MECTSTKTCAPIRALIAAYVACAWRRSDAGDEAEATLSKALKQDWNEELVALYGRLRDGLAPIDDAQPPKAGSRRVPTTPLCCSRWDALRLANRDWRKAREYFEASLKRDAAQRSTANWDGLCLAMGERPRASELLAQSMTSAARCRVAAAAGSARTLSSGA